MLSYHRPCLQGRPEPPMNHRSRRPTTRAHALRLDPPSILHGGIAASITFLVAWLIQQI